MSNVITKVEGMVFGKGILGSPWSLTLWEVPEGENGAKSEKNPNPWTMTQTQDMYRKKLGKDGYAAEKDRRTVTFRIDYEGMSLKDVLDLHDADTTLRKRFRNNNWAANCNPSLEDVEAMIERAARAKKAGEPYVRLTKEDLTPTGRVAKSLTEKSDDELLKAFEAEEKRMAKLKAEIERRKAAAGQK